MVMARKAVHSHHVSRQSPSICFMNRCHLKCCCSAGKVCCDICVCKQGEQWRAREYGSGSQRTRPCVLGQPLSLQPPPSRNNRFLVCERMLCLHPNELDDEFCDSIHWASISCFQLVVRVPSLKEIQFHLLFVPRDATR